MGAPPARGGVPLAVAAYLIWGLLPLYLVRLAHVPSIDVVAHRVIWSLVFLVLLVGITRRLPAILRALGDRRVRATLLASATLLSVNWLLYIWAVQNGYVDDVAVERIKEFQAGWSDFLVTRRSALLTRIGAVKALSAELTGELKNAADQFKQTWKK